MTLWLSDHAMDRLALTAPDFFDWHSLLASFNLPGVDVAERSAELPIPPRTESAPFGAGVLSAEAAARQLDALHDQAARFRQAGADPEARRRLAQTLEAIAEIYLDQPVYKDWQLAVQPLQEAAGIYAELSERGAEAQALANAGRALYWIDHYLDARRCYRRALDLYQQVGARLGEANTIQALGDVHRALSEYVAARGRYEEALPLYRATGDRLGEANTLTGLADLALAMGDDAYAQAAYENALGVFRAIGLVHSEAILYRNRAYHLIELNRLDEAAADCAHALELEPNHPYSHGRQGYLHLARGEYAWALACFERALELSPAGHWHFELALAHLGLGQVDQAREALQRGLAEATAGERREMVRWLRRLAGQQPELEDITTLFLEQLGIDPTDREEVSVE